MAPRLRRLQRWLVFANRLSIHSLRVRILLGFLLVSLTTFTVAGLAYWYQAQSEKIDVVRNLSSKVLLDIVRMQKAEAEFNSKAILTPRFFETGLDPSLQEHNESFQGILASLQALAASLPKAMSKTQNGLAKHKIDEMGRIVGLQNADFAQYAGQMRKRGFLSYGLMGDMRNSAHQLEAGSQFQRADILQLRRHEKDYLLRRDTAYYRQAKQLGQNLLAQSGAAVAAKSQADLLRAYLQKFDELVILEARLGLTEAAGLQQKIAQGSVQMTREVEALNDLLLSESQDLGNRYRNIFLGLAGIAILLTLALSIYFAFKITHPIRNITDFMHREMEGKFQGETRALDLPGRGEMRTLAHDVQLMARQIRTQLEEITAQSEALAERNAALTNVNAELQETQAKQAALLRVREKVHSIISHDLRAPVNGIMGYLNLILEAPEEFGPEQTTKFAEQMLKSVTRLSEMLENLLRWSLFQSGELVTNPGWLNLNAAVERCMGLYADAAARKEVSLHWTLDREWKVLADSEMLDFILRNLVSNAIKFSKMGGNVQLEVSLAGTNQVRISLQDTGVGIPAQQIIRMFEQGEHITTSGTKKEKGTGFGLMLCRDFVAHLGGKLEVNSQVGVGTEVTFTLEGTANLELQQNVIEIDQIQ